jgi:hypothetical protein
LSPVARIYHPETNVFSEKVRSMESNSSARTVSSTEGHEQLESKQMEKKMKRNLDAIGNRGGDSKKGGKSNEMPTNGS